MVDLNLKQSDNHTPSQLDLIPLDVQVSPSAAPAGERLSSLSFLLLNYSESGFAAPTSAGIYISTDADITTTDTRLGTINFTPNLIFPKTVVRVNVPSPPRIPGGLARGPYWIGVILELDDGQPANNATDGQEAAAIYVLPLDCNGRTTLLSRGTLRPGLLPQL